MCLALNSNNKPSLKSRRSQLPFIMPGPSTTKSIHGLYSYLIILAFICFLKCPPILAHENKFIELVNVNPNALNPDQLNLSPNTLSQGIRASHSGNVFLHDGKHLRYSELWWFYTYMLWLWPLPTFVLTGKKSVLKIHNNLNPPVHVWNFVVKSHIKIFVWNRQKLINFVVHTINSQVILIPILHSYCHKYKVFLNIMHVKRRFKFL